MLGVIYAEYFSCWVSFMLSVIYSKCHSFLVSYTVLINKIVPKN
jgi:hypothetical protein